MDKSTSRFILNTDDYLFLMACVVLDSVCNLVDYHTVESRVRKLIIKWTFCVHRTRKAKLLTWSVSTHCRQQWCIMQYTNSSKQLIRFTMSAIRLRLLTSCRMLWFWQNRWENDQLAAVYCYPWRVMVNGTVSRILGNCHQIHRNVKIATWNSEETFH